jgi:cytochrome d ubiquinol oxidase subunit I
MDAVLLSRIQFGFAAGFHFIFPPLTLGLTLIIFILETIYFRKNSEIHKEISTFLIRILALIFTLGVASGIVLEFSFGTNWAEYSRMVGDIFGAPLAAEAVFSFFLESTFLAILLFGRSRVSKRAYLTAAFLVFFASHLSGLWIIIANSWMQTPAGYAIENGRAVLTDFFAAALNPSTGVRYLHTVMAAWVTGSLFAAGISSWYLLKKRSENIFRPLLKICVVIFIITGALQFVSGHLHAVQVGETQPAKMAAFEAVWKTGNGVPMSLFGIPSETTETTKLEIAVPKLLSIMMHFDSNSEVKGLNEFSKDEWPPIVPTYLTYHLMVIIGIIFGIMAIIALILLANKKLFTANWFLKVLLIAAPLPLIANTLGWVAAEIGRQPWAVYGILKTADAASKAVPAWQALVSLILFVIVYSLLFAVFLTIFSKIVKRGPESKI